MVIDEAPDPEAARAEARRIARAWLMFDSEPDIEGFSLAYAGAACSGGCELTRAPVQGVRSLLVFPSLTWRKVRAVDSMLGRSILLRLEDGRLWRDQAGRELRAGGRHLTRRRPTAREGDKDLRDGPRPRRSNSNAARAKLFGAPVVQAIDG
jgi:hypothetical protein